MAVILEMTMAGDKRLQQMLRRLNPKLEGREWQREALIESGLLVQEIAAKKKIRGGGRFRGPAGPRGGRGKLQSRPSHPTMLTSRSGRLVKSIRINRGPLPRAIEVGTDVKYAHVHEKGGRFGRARFPRRAFMAPGLHDASKQFSKIWVRNIEKVLKR